MKTYRIRPVEDLDPANGWKARLSRVIGRKEPAVVTVPPLPLGSACFAAVADKTRVGLMTLQGPRAVCHTARAPRRSVALLKQLEVDAEHRDLGCREALLDVALHWARANECSELAVTLAAEPQDMADFYLANGFHFVGREPGWVGDGLGGAVLSQPLAAARPHTAAWFSAHHGMWFAPMARH